MSRPEVWRVALLGAESTGKSTLAAALARHYRTLWVPEYLREFVELRQRVPLEAEQTGIARMQLAREEAAVARLQTGRPVGAGAAGLDAAVDAQDGGRAGVGIDTGTDAGIAVAAGAAAGSLDAGICANGGAAVAGAAAGIDSAADVSAGAGRGGAGPVDSARDAGTGTPAWLFCDTTPLMIALYSDHYFHRHDAALAHLAARKSYRHTLVTAPDTPWVADGLQRESAAVRQQIHTRLLATLQGLGIAHTLITGSPAERLAQARRVLDGDAAGAL